MSLVVPRRRIVASRIMLGIALSVALAIFCYPFVGPLLPANSDRGPALAYVAIVMLALVMVVTVGLIWCVVATVPDASAAGAKLVSLLAAIVAIDAGLRLIPSLSGASAIFLLIILAGYVFGAQFGFLVGSLTLVLSAFLTAGIGPWLPFQMMAAGWVGTGAAVLPRQRRRDYVWLPIYGALSGIIYGLLMSLSAWPLAAPGVSVDASLYWTVDLPPLDLISRYLAYYAATSVFHDLFRAIGNAALLAIFGPPLVRVLSRAHDRLNWSLM